MGLVLIAGATSIFVVFAITARAPGMPFHWMPAELLIIAILVLLVCEVALWQTTRFD